MAGVERRSAIVTGAGRGIGAVHAEDFAGAMRFPRSTDGGLVTGRTPVRGGGPVTH